MNLKQFVTAWATVMLVSFMLYGCAGAGESSQGAGEGSSVISTVTTNNVDDGATLIINQLPDPSEEEAEEEWFDEEAGCSVESHEAEDC